MVSRKAGPAGVCSFSVGVAACGSHTSSIRASCSVGGKARAVQMGDSAGGAGLSAAGQRLEEIAVFEQRAKL